MCVRGENVAENSPSGEAEQKDGLFGLGTLGVLQLGQLSWPRGLMVSGRQDWQEGDCPADVWAQKPYPSVKQDHPAVSVSGGSRRERIWSGLVGSVHSAGGQRKARLENSGKDDPPPSQSHRSDMDPRG